MSPHPSATTARRRRPSWLIGLIRPIVTLCLGATVAYAQDPARAAADVLTIPAAPQTIVRASDGRTTIRAIRIATPLRLDGAMDEAVYTENQPFSDFIQMEPRGG